MSDMELGELQDELGDILGQLKVDQLHEVCLYAKVPAGSQDRKHMLIMKISEIVENAVEDDEKEVAHEFLNRLITKADEIRKSKMPQVVEENSEEDTATLASLKKQYSALQLSFQASARKLEEEMTRLASKVMERGVSQLPTQPDNPFSTHPPEVTIRREFKINGQIGERGQRDKLSYSNLMHQIDMGLKKNTAKWRLWKLWLELSAPGCLFGTC